MKFKVSTFGPTGLFVADRKINWIKDFREQTGCSLKESKDVADWLTYELNGRRASYLVLDSQSDIKFRFLTSNVMIKLGTPTLIANIEPVETPRDAAIVELERTAARLIKLGEYKKARDVLKILVNSH
jgi:hypothetical protein